MHNAINAVLEFHEAVDQHIGDPRAPDIMVDQELRQELIREEFEELKLALQGHDKDGNALSKDEQVIAVADALGDLAYVVCGAAVTWGIDLGSVFDAIHASNMSKCPEGISKTNDLKMRAEKRPDGKVLKGPNYHPPDIAGALALAKAEANESGFGEDSFWPVPSKERKGTQLELKLEEPPPVNPALKLAAAMKSIKEDFVPDLKGYFTSYGAYIFDCTKCQRTHAVDTKQGTRNGWASKGKCACICGMSYELVFVENKCKDPTVQARAVDLGGLAHSGGA